jgi:hypothetical protein
VNIRHMSGVVSGRASGTPRGFSGTWP